MVAALIMTIGLAAFAQDAEKTERETENQTYSYAVIYVTQTGFSNKLKVVVDFGDTPEQINAARDYSEILETRKSFVGVLNYMAERQFELVHTHFSQNGVTFIMRRKKKEP